jgi:hypothetical protein
MIRGTLAEVLADVTLDRSFLLIELDDGSFAVVEGTNEDWEKLSTIPQKIAKVCVRFRSSRLELSPHNAKGYFFRPGVGASLSAQIQQYNLFVIGHLEEDGETVQTFTVVVPELLLVNSDRRSRYDQETVGSSLITS